MEKLKVNGRDAEAIRYSFGILLPGGIRKVDALEVNVMLNNEDCPKKKALEERFSCVGGCENTYFGITFESSGIISIGGTLNGREITYLSYYGKSLGISTLEELYEFLKKRNATMREERGRKVYLVDGEVIARYVPKEFCGYFFPIPVEEQEEIRNMILMDKEDTAEWVNANLEKLMKVARHAGKEDCVKFGLKAAGKLVEEKIRKEKGDTYIERAIKDLFVFDE